jgi:hypothetical protein
VARGIGAVGVNVRIPPASTTAGPFDRHVQDGGTVTVRANGARVQESPGPHIVRAAASGKLVAYT